MAWRKISTAPKDGTWLLLFDPGIEPSVTTGAYMKAEKRRDNGRFQQGGWYMAEWDGMPSMANPTHWQPLRAPPATR